ncbi:MAG TPA: uroporphyrinogen-III synthase [Ignavibacteriaceae bacterium]|nr:uroporphyrinogen-III synthase [Ignavibacteriaceae bacterium]
MTVQERRENRKNLKRERIIETAFELFSKKGYHEVMMEDVAKLTSVAKGTVYNYFSSKEELYFSIMKQRMEKLTNSLTGKVENETNSIDSLRSFVTHLYMFMMKYQNFFLMYRKEFLKADNEICIEFRLLEKKLNDLLSGIIRNGEIKGLFRKIDEDFAVNVILGSIFGAVQRGIDNNIDDQEARKSKEKIFDFVLHGLFSGFDDKKVLPLKDKTIVITRTVEQSKESSAVFSELGAEVIIFPTLEIVPPSSWKQFDEAVIDHNKIDFIIFTSAHSVKMFAERLRQLNLILNFSKIKVVAVGNKTASICKDFGIPVNIIPLKFSGDAVVDELSKYNLKEKIIFIPRSAIGREALPKELRELGAVIKSVPVYNVSLPSEETVKEYIEQLNLNKPDLFIFTSPSTFENFLQIMKIEDPVRYFKKYFVAAIGPTTKLSIEERKVRVDIIPDEFTIDGLAKAIVNHYKKESELN